MTASQSAPAANRLLMSGNEAVARAVWDAGARVASGYPGTPSTEMIETISTYPGIYAEWSVNEKVSLEVAIGASMAGSRSFCAMKHVGVNVAADALMTLTLTGTAGGLVVAVADDVGLSSSQNEQDSRVWGRFAHLPVLEPSDSQEAYEMAIYAFELSELFHCPVLLRMTTRVCHVKAVVGVGHRVDHPGTGFVREPARWVMVPGNAGARIPLMHSREKRLREFSEDSPLNRVIPGGDRRVGFIASGPAYLHVREAYPAAPVLKLGFSCPVPVEKARRFAASVERLVVVEETEPLVENELKAAGIDAHGKDILPAAGEIPPDVIRPALARLLGEPEPAAGSIDAQRVFPRPPTMCVACPHLGVYYTLAQLKNVIVSGDIGCYTLGAGHPWHALDSTICMGASMGIALGLDKGRSPADANKKIVAVIGDSTFLHTGMQGLADIVWNRGNVTVLILDNRAVGMTGGQNTPANGRDIRGEQAPRIDFAKLVEALGVNPERIRVVDPYQLPVLFKALREETRIDEPSVIITNQPCVLIDDYEKLNPYRVLDEACTGCGNCFEVGCPAIHVQRREKAVKPSGRLVELMFARIETEACTGCGLCVQPCAPDAIVHARAARAVIAIQPAS